MAKPYIQAGVLLTVAFAVHAAMAQAPAVDAAEQPEADAPDVETAGELVMLEELVVTGRRREIQQAVTEVVSVLSAEEIARTGEGDVAGALSRIPGLSVVGGGFVYVRGLGDRYSSALLNGSPLPSPEPLRRAIPLDLFPTDVIASSLVQKTYSPNYSGEFGGGVINLTTLAVPKESFFKLSAGVSGDTETTGQLGYDHYGSKYDWTGFNGGLRDTPPALAAFFASGDTLSSGSVDGGAIASELVGWRNGLAQKIPEMPGNYSATLTGGKAWSLESGSELGLVATAGYDNKWRTRDNLAQSPGSADLSSLSTSYREVATENHAVVNALLGVAYQSGPNTLRWTNLYIHDTVKRTALSDGVNTQQPGKDFRDQDTGWYERQLLSSQLAGSFDFQPFTLGGRLAVSQSKRDAPFELGIGYSRSNVTPILDVDGNCIPATCYGQYFINRLDNGDNGFARIAFSDLSEDLISGGTDLTWRMAPGVVLQTGYDYAYTSRESQRREFQIVAPSSEEWNQDGTFLLRPDYLLSADMIDHYNFQLFETTETDPAFSARMLTHGAYAQVQARLAPGLELSAGARYEEAKQVIRAKQVFDSFTPSTNRVKNDYVLPAATLTWKFGETQNQQIRLNASKTIARPQFRELIQQAFYDPESNRSYSGNPLLSDSKFLNAELRYEAYYTRGQRFSLAGFYKQIDNPIEVNTSFNDNTPISSYANAPEATLHGAELELVKYFMLDSFSENDGGLLNSFLGMRRFVVTTNYTWTQSEIKVGSGDMVQYFTPSKTEWLATDFFRDGSRLTGQSDHLLNLQLGLERPDELSQLTLLFSYASDRVTSRGAIGAGLPDVKESPGVKVDLVARQGLNLFGQAAELKLDARNIFGRGYREFQRSGDNVVYYNKYDVGTSFGLSVSMSF